MLHEIPQVIEKAHNSDTLGRVIAYGGGGTVAATSKFMEIIQTTTIADWALWVSSLAVLGRLVFDIYKYAKGQRGK